MPPIPTLQHLASLQHARQIQIAEYRHRLFRQPLTARSVAATPDASVIAMPVLRHSAASRAKVA
jgi:hypothetical protein